MKNFQNEKFSSKNFEKFSSKNFQNFFDTFPPGICAHFGEPKYALIKVSKMQTRA